MAEKKIQNVSDFIREVSEIIKEYDSDIIVYRGEDQVHDEPCIPSIFRDGVLRKSKLYEKQLFDSMRQNEVTNSASYLYNAIDAQHGEFKSRLLDVTYNCLVALYFAVTPYYHHPEDKHDDEPGQVFVFHLDHAFSPSSEETKDCFKNIIEKKNDIISSNLLFSKNHKFIDHCKINNRIVAQQGAFILFQGDDADSLPAYMFQGIEIPGSSKKNLRDELNVLFGINTGTIYPEIVNLVSELTKKCKKMSTISFNVVDELDSISKQLEMELNYYYDACVDAVIIEKKIEIMRVAEKVFLSYLRGILDMDEYLDKHPDKEVIKVFREFTKKYNMLLDDFNKCLPVADRKLIEIDNFKVENI
ncbi:FRG domain-containing protein [Lachnospiraceae bacterium G11]|nr:FRG domain-containing protein [Lachnospiraceae bacterium G11]